MSSLRKRKGWFSIIGKRADRSQWTHPLRTRDPVLANAMLAQWKAEHGEAAPDGLEPGTPWRKALDAFLERVGETATSETVRCYRTPLERLFTAWGDTPPAAWTSAMFRLWVKAHPAWEPRTKQLLAGASRRFIKWARGIGWPVGDFVGDFKAPRIIQKPPEVLDGPTLRKFLRAARDCPGELAAALSALAGLRLGEVKRAAWEDWNAATATLHVRGRKGHTERIVSVSTDLAEVLQRRKATGTMVPRARADEIRRDLQPIAERIGLARYPTLRVLRHTFCSRMVARGVDLATAQRLMGHKSPVMTMRYAHSDDRRTRAAVDKVL